MPSRRKISSKRGGSKKRTARAKNPASEYMGRCTRIEYINAGDHVHYYHDFKAPVSIYANADGTVVLLGKKPLVGERLL